MMKKPRICFHADDYGMTEESSRRILECGSGGLDSLGIVPNGCLSYGISQWKKTKLACSIHLNLVEGRPVADSKRLSLLLGKDGMFRNSFEGLLLLSLSPERRRLKEQAALEFRAQLRAVAEELPSSMALRIDSHQHIHMIPLLFRTLLEVLEEENVPVEALRIPVEPFGPFIKNPGLYPGYSLVNLVKNTALHILYLFNKGPLKKSGYQSPLFCGIMFSGHMDEKRLTAVFPEFYRLAVRRGQDLEFVFHPGYLEDGEPFMEGSRGTFRRFEQSPGRKLEYRTLTGGLKKKLLETLTDPSELIYNRNR